MKKGSKFSLFVLLLLLVSYLMTLGSALPIASTAASDITKNISIMGSKIIDNKGVEKSTENPIRVNDSIVISYLLKINQEWMTQIEVGDTFRVSLPDDTYFRVKDNLSALSLKDSVTGEIFGQASLTGNHLIVTINESGARQKVLNSLQLTIGLKAVKAGNEIDAGGNSSLNIPKLEIIETPLTTVELLQAEMKVEGKMAASRNFEYVIVDQSDEGKPIAYGVTERMLDRQDESVMIDFYKVKTIEGAFKDKIETDWRTLLKDGHSYLIHEVPDPEYVAVITGGIGEGNQYDYQAEKNRSVRFRILKQPVTKKQLPSKISDIPMLAVPKMKKIEETTSIERGVKKQAANDFLTKETKTPVSTSRSDKEGKEEKGINLTKTDSATGEKLQGAEFELKNAAGEKMYLRRKLITDENGLLHINSLPEGEYSLVEIKAPEGYVLDSEPLTFTFTKEDKLVVLTKENAKDGAAVPVKKDFPQSSETREEFSSQQASKPSSNSKKQYPRTGELTNPLVTFLGFGILGVLWIVRKKMG